MHNQAGASATIAAIATSPGVGGIGIVRISGAGSGVLLRRLFHPVAGVSEFISHHLYYGTIIDPATERLVDEVLAVFMRGPKTYTREDVVEIHCHGSFFVLQSILSLVIQGGARLAEPGEFTKRAFLNGRIDLTQAEAVIDIVSAKTQRGVDCAAEQMNGALYRRIESIRTAVLEIRALLEVAVDFPEDDIEIVDPHTLSHRLDDEVVQPLAGLVDSGNSGRLLRDGALVVIAGVPNVGKSSLLNCLLEEDRALVTDIPGTTRDIIEEYIDIDGIPVRLVDTAGIRPSAQGVEQLGIERAQERINSADLVIFVVDGSTALGAEDRALYETIKHKPIIHVINKCDQPQRIEDDPFPPACPLPVSATRQLGIDRLKEEIFTSLCGENNQWRESDCIPNLRQQNSLKQALEAAVSARNALASGVTADLVGIDIIETLDHLAVIVGESTTEEVLDLIFSRFCLGK